ncbi:hypothetical protein OG496_55300 [Streptomyces sp. NBC_00988]|uniref:hypothetical protein n=1 Tax=Streptomyces sp. NBC_00988 TaxID=2903704 RepID=UPI00386E420C|nr:hypothetical protein OG496_55300 [Streptomyces sp. NBC_00988]
MVKIAWDKLAESPKASESLVTLLMLRLHSRARAVDGSGGDGGRDLFEYTEGGELTVYEAKSFTGRMTPGRRRQVVRSLMSAARHQPDHWDLLVPIDQTPAEQRWFDGLRVDFPFVREWRGRSWLDEKFAAHPDLVRYALQESSDYILERITEARAERDVLLGGLPDYIKRANALHARAQEISPHYAVHTTQDADGQTVVRLTPKGPAPDGQAAIRFTGRIRFPADDPQEAQRQRQFEETLRFGGEVELTADNLTEAGLAGPAGLGLEQLTLGTVRITSPHQDVTPPLRGQVIVQQPSGIPVTSLSVTFTHRVLGTAGGTLHGSDATGLMRVRLRFNHRDLSGRLTFSFEPPETAMPTAMVPVLRLLAESHPGRFVALVFAGDTTGGMRAPITTGMTPPGWEAGEAQFWADAYDDLARLQSRTSRYFPVPDDFTQQDAREIKEIHALLDGEKTILRGETVSAEVISAEGLDQLAGIRDGMFRLTAGYESMIFTLGDHQIDLGPCTETYTMDKILNMPEAQRELAEHGHATVIMRLAEHTPAVRYLGTEQP